MKTPSTPLLALAVLAPVPLLAALHAPAEARGAGTATRAEPERLVWAPAEGVRLAHDVTTQQYLTLDEITLTLSGREQNPKQYLDIVSTQRVRTVDHVRRREGGRPTELRRAYEALELDAVIELPSGAGARETRTLEATSPLQGKSVVFTWVPAREAYGAYYDLEAGPEHLLADLDATGDYRELLPPSGAAEEGATWEIPPAALAAVIAAGGHAHLEVTAGDDPVTPRLLMSGAGGALGLLFGEVEGEAKGTYRGRREVEGQSYAVLGFEFEVTTARDLTELARDQVTQMELVSGAEAEGFFTKTSVAGRGELLWDVAAGHAKALDLQGNTWLERTERFTAPDQIRGGTMERRMTLKGTLSISAEVTESAP